MVVKICNQNHANIHICNSVTIGEEDCNTIMQENQTINEICESILCRMTIVVNLRSVVYSKREEWLADLHGLRNADER